MVIFAAAYAASATIQKGAGFLVIMWLGHILSVEDYAAFGLLMALQAAVAAFASAGIVESVIGKLHTYSSPSSRQNLLRGADLVFLAMASAVAGATAIGYLSLHWRQISSALELSAVVSGGLFTAFFTVKSGLVRLTEEHVASVALASLPPLAGFLFGFVAFTLQGTVVSYFVGMALGLVGSLLVSLAFKPHLFVLPAHTTEAVAVAGKMPTFVLIGALGWLVGYGNTYIVEFFFKASDVAQFTFAYSLSSIMQLISTSLNQVWSPRFFARAHTVSLEELERQNSRFFVLHGAVLGAVGFALLVVTPIALQAVGGNLAHYAHMPGKLFFLFAAYALLLPWYHSQNYFLAHGRGAELMNVIIVSSLLGLALLPIAISVFGVLGVYLGFLIQMGAKSCVAMIWAWREWRLRLAYEGALLATLLIGLGAITSTLAGN